MTHPNRCRLSASPGTSSMSLSDIPTVLRRHASTLLIVMGAILLVYVSLQYGEMYWNQRRLQQQWAQQQSEQARGMGNPAATAAKDDGLTRLSIPRIDLAAVVVEGV